MNTSHKIFMAAGLFALLSSTAFSQSSGIAWKNGNVLTAQQLQQLDNAKMNVDSLGKPGFAPKLNAQGQITNPVVGSVANAPANTAGDTVSSIADTAKSAQTTANGAVQANGGDASKTVVTPTGDTASHALSDVAAQATGSVQKTSIGVANGVAPLDDNKMMSAAVSGDSSSSPVLATSTTTPRIQADRAADLQNVKDFGAKLDGSSSDEASIASAFSSNPNKKLITIPAGTWPSQSWSPAVSSDSKFVNVSGYLANPPNVSVTDYGIDLGFYNFGSGVTSVTHGSDYFPNSVMTSRVSTGTTDTSYDPMVSHRQYIDGPNNNHDGNNTEENIAISGPNSSGYITNVFDKHYSLGHGYYGSFDVNHWSRMDVYGTNWAWDGLQEFGESVTYFCNSSTADSSLCVAHYINEVDFGGYGADDPAAAYDPDKATRTAFLLSTNTTAAKNTTRASWAANKSFWKYQQVIVQDSSGKPWIFYALPTGYTVGGSNNASSASSGSTAPTWVFTAGSTVTDGGLTWYCEGPFTYDIGAMIKVSGGNSPSTGYIERIGTLIEESNDYIYNAIFDMSLAQFDPSVPYKVFGRLQKDVYLDMTADGTQSGQNNHLLGYDSTSSALVYKVSGVNNFRIGDNGNTSFGENSSGAVGLQIGSQVAKNVSYIDFFANGNSNASARILSSDSALTFLYNDASFSQSVHVGWSLYLGVMTKADILALTSPSEGQKVYDSDDHEEVTYRCPTTSTCGWFPVQYGTALSK